MNGAFPLITNKPVLPGAILTPSSSHESSTVHPQEKRASNMSDSIHLSNQLCQTVLQLILKSSQPDTLLFEIARHVEEWLEVDVCLIVAETQKTIRNQINVVEKGKKLELSTIAQHKLITQTRLTNLFNAVEPTKLSDLNQGSSDTTLETFQEILSLQSLLGIETTSKQGNNGLLIVGYCQPYAWTSQEVEVLKNIQALVGFAISQVQLQYQVQTSNNYQKLINELTGVIRNSSNLDPILQTALMGTAQALEVYQGMLILLCYDTPIRGHRVSKKVPTAKATVACQWSANPEVQGESSDKFRLVDCDLCQQAWQNAPQSLVISDCKSFAGNLVMPEVFDMTQNRALLMVPLMGSSSHNSHQGTILGFVVLQHQHPRIWQPDELEFVNWVGAQVSTAILHHRSLRRVHSLVDEQTYQLKWSSEVQAKLSEKMRHQLEQLQRADKLKGEFLATIQDQLKTPLTEMKMAIQMLKIPGIPSERQTQYLDILEKAWQREHQLIQDLLTWRTLQSEDYTIQPTKLHLSQVIGELSQSFEDQWNGKGITLITEYYWESILQDSPESLPPFSTDLESFQRILSELLLNAGKFSNPTTTTKLTIQQVSEQIVLTITNLGSVLLEHEYDRIFEPFYRGQEIPENAIPGIGLGLALVKSLVEHLNGTIEVSSDETVDEQTSQTCFTLTLPQVLLSQ